MMITRVRNGLVAGVMGISTTLIMMLLAVTMWETLVKTPWIVSLTPGGAVGFATLFAVNAVVLATEFLRWMRKREARNNNVV